MAAQSLRAHTATVARGDPVQPWERWRASLLLNSETDFIVTSPCDVVAACGHVAPTQPVPAAAFRFLVDTLAGLAAELVKCPASSQQRAAVLHRATAAVQCGVSLLKCTRQQAAKHAPSRRVAPPLIDIDFRLLGKACATERSARAHRFLLQLVCEALRVSRVQGRWTEWAFVSRLLWKREDTGYRQVEPFLQLHKSLRCVPVKPQACDVEWCGSHATPPSPGWDDHQHSEQFSQRVGLILRAVPALLTSGTGQDAAVASLLMRLVDGITRVNGLARVRATVVQAARCIKSTHIQVTFVRMIADEALRAAVVWDLIAMLQVHSDAGGGVEWPFADPDAVTCDLAEDVTHMKLAASSRVSTHALELESLTTLRRCAIALSRGTQSPNTRRKFDAMLSTAASVVVSVVSTASPHAGGGRAAIAHGLKLAILKRAGAGGECGPSLDCSGVFQRLVQAMDDDKSDDDNRHRECCRRSLLCVADMLQRACRVRVESASVPSGVTC